MSAHSAGAYTATLLVMVNVMKGGGRAPPPSPARANFTLMTECTPENSGCYSVLCGVDRVVDGGQCGLQLFHIGRGIWPNENISLAQLFFPRIGWSQYLIYMTIIPPESFFESSI